MMLHLARALLLAAAACALPDAAEPATDGPTLAQRLVCEAYEATSDDPLALRSCDAKLSGLYRANPVDYFADNCQICGDGTDDDVVVCEVFTPDGEVLGLCRGDTY